MLSYVLILSDSVIKEENSVTLGVILKVIVLMEFVTVLMDTEETIVQNKHQIVVVY